MRSRARAVWLGLVVLLVGMGVGTRGEARTAERMQVGHLVQIYDYFSRATTLGGAPRFRTWTG